MYVQIFFVWPLRVGSIFLAADATSDVVFLCWNSCEASASLSIIRLTRRSPAEDWGDGEDWKRSWRACWGRIDCTKNKDNDGDGGGVDWQPQTAISVFSASICVLLLYMLCMCIQFQCAQWSGSTIRRFWSDTQGRAARGVRGWRQMAYITKHTHTWPHHRSDGMVLILSTCQTSPVPRCETSVRLITLCLFEHCEILRLFFMLINHLGSRPSYVSYDNHLSYLSSTS